MSRDEDKLIRQLSLVSFLLSHPRPFSAREVQESVEGYAEMSDETFVRRFHGDRADLGKIGIEIRTISGGEAPPASEAQLYLLSEEDFRLPAVEFTAAEVRALSLALAALDGRFAYARPLRLALTAILRGRHEPVNPELGQLPVALAPDEDARRAGKQLSRLEEAVTRGKTVSFSYPSGEDGVCERTLDPYCLYLIQGHWYVVGHDHLRDGIRTFRLGRIQGTVRFATEKTRDFSIPPDFDPDEYRARPPWRIGPLRGTALVKVDDDLSWWVERLAPHVSHEAEDADGCALFAMPYADEAVLLSWVVGLGGRGELLGPPVLRAQLRNSLTAVCAAHEGEGAGTETARPAAQPPGRRSKPSSPPVRSEEKTAPIAPEHLARALTLLYYLADEHRPQLVTWQMLKNDLGLTRAEIEPDLSLINLVNYGGGTYALFAEAGPEGVAVSREVMADTFSRPARLSPVMARALLLALDVLGDSFALEGLESLESVRKKIHTLVGTEGGEGGVIVEDVLRPDPAIVEVLNRAIRDRSLVALEYYTASRQELSERLVEPYLLFHSPDGWYLEAFCLKAREQRTFKLERIRTAVGTGQTFVPRPEVDLSGRRTGRAFPPDEAVAWATVRFNPRWRTYLEDSGKEYIVQPDGTLEARMPYGNERWMAQEIVRFLGDAVLEHPASLRKTVRELAAGLLARYETEHVAADTAATAGSAAGPGSGGTAGDPATPASENAQ
jgi:proteasome accessory factor C